METGSTGLVKHIHGHWLGHIRTQKRIDVLNSEDNGNLKTNNDRKERQDPPPCSVSSALAKHSQLTYIQKFSERNSIATNSHRLKYPQGRQRTILFTISPHRPSKKPLPSSSPAAPVPSRQPSKPPPSKPAHSAPDPAQPPPPPE